MWPHGQIKDRVDLDEWAKDVTLSNELRKLYGHNRDLFEEFTRRCIGELNRAPAADIVTQFRQLGASKDQPALWRTRRDLCHGAISKGLIRWTAKAQSVILENTRTIR